MLISISNKGISCDFTKSEGDIDLQYANNEGVIQIFYGYLYKSSSNTWLNPDSNQKLDSTFYQDTDGSGAFIYIDQINNSIKLFTDPYRLYQLYVYKNKNIIYISNYLSEIKNQCQLSTNLDALLELYSINTTVGDKTIFNEIQFLKAGCFYEFTLKGESITETYKELCGFPQPTGNRVTAKTIAEVFVDHVQSGLTFSNNFSLALTSGLDSRATLSAALHQKNRLHTYTHGYSNSMDVQVATRIAKTMRVKHRFYDLNDSDGFINRIPVFYDEISKYYEGSLNGLSHAHAILSYGNQKKYADTFLSSFGGELYRSYYLPQGLDAKPNLDQMAEGILKMSSVPLNEDLFSFGSGWQEVVLQGIYNELKLSPFQSSTQYLADYYYQRRNFNSVTTRFAGKYFKIFNPYFQRDLFQLLQDVPAEERVNGKIQKQIIRIGDSRLSGFLLNNKTPVIDNFQGKLEARIALLDYYAKVAINKLTNQWMFKLYFTDYNQWIKSEHSTWFNEAFEMEYLFDTGIDLDNAKEISKEWLSGDRPFTDFKMLTNVFSTLKYLSQ